MKTNKILAQKDMKIRVLEEQLDACKNDRKRDRGLLAEAQKGTVPYHLVQKIWNAAELYTMQHLGEVKKGDPLYQENPIDLQSYFHKHHL